MRPSLTDLRSRRRTGRQGGHAEQGATFSDVEVAELDGEFVGSRVPLVHEVVAEGVEVLLAACDAFHEGAGLGAVENLDVGSRALGELDAGRKPADASAVLHRTPKHQRLFWSTV